MRAAAGRAAGLLVSLVCLVAVVAWVVRQDAPSLPTGQGLAWVLVGVVVYLVACALRAERWRLLLRADGADPTRGDCYALTAVGFMGNNVLPARAGDVLRVVLLAPRAAASRRSVLGSLVAERIADVAVLLVLFLLVGVNVIGAGDVSLPVSAATIAAAALLLVAVTALAVVRWADVARRLLASLRPVGAAVRRGLAGRVGRRVLAVSVAVWAVEALVWMSASAATQIGLSLLETASLLSVAAVAVLVPSGPGYAGTLDAAVLIGLVALGTAQADAIAYLLVLRFVLLVPISLLGLVALVRRYGGLRMVRTAT